MGQRFLGQHDPAEANHKPSLSPNSDRRARPRPTPPARHHSRPSAPPGGSPRDAPLASTSTLTAASTPPHESPSLRPFDLPRGPPPRAEPRREVRVYPSCWCWCWCWCWCLRGGSGAPTCTCSRIDRPGEGTFRGGTPTVQHSHREHDPAEVMHKPSLSPKYGRQSTPPSSTARSAPSPNLRQAAAKRPTAPLHEHARRCLSATPREHEPPSQQRPTWTAQHAESTERPPAHHLARGGPSGCRCRSASPTSVRCPRCDSRNAPYRAWA